MGPPAYCTCKHCQHRPVSHRVLLRASYLAKGNCILCREVSGLEALTPSSFCEGQSGLSVLCRGSFTSYSDTGIGRSQDLVSVSESKSDCDSCTDITYRTDESSIVVIPGASFGIEANIEAKDNGKQSEAREGCADGNQPRCVCDGVGVVKVMYPTHDGQSACCGSQQRSSSCITDSNTCCIPQSLSRRSCRARR